MSCDLHATINNVVDHLFSLRDQRLLDKDAMVQLLKQARRCESVEDVLALPISDPVNFLVELSQLASKAQDEFSVN